MKYKVYQVVIDYETNISNLEWVALGSSYFIEYDSMEEAYSAILSHGYDNYEYTILPHIKITP